MLRRCEAWAPRRHPAPHHATPPVQVLRALTPLARNTAHAGKATTPAADLPLSRSRLRSLHSTHGSRCAAPRTPSPSPRTFRLPLASAAAAAVQPSPPPHTHTPTWTGFAPENGGRDEDTQFFFNRKSSLTCNSRLPGMEKLSLPSPFPPKKIRAVEGSERTNRAAGRHLGQVRTSQPPQASPHKLRPPNFSPWQQDCEDAEQREEGRVEEGWPSSAARA